MNNKKMRAGGFTLVEIMIVVAIIGLLISVAVPKFSKMRSDAQETSCFVQLKQIDNAKEIWATREKRANGQIPTADQLAEYIDGGIPTCPGGGGEYVINAVGEKATCPTHGNMESKNSL
ncbi:MAG: prepilin-type cleavage/methylation domain-containing protein [Verrucomicrobiales bacterium]|nr:prepilin-type cleavage/methylation domain-containing protein [Verrucomicrobiales bacterium]